MTANKTVLLTIRSNSDTNAVDVVRAFIRR